MPSFGSCETCSTAFKFYSFHKKVRCVDCAGQFCMNCSVRSAAQSDHRRCTICSLYWLGPSLLSRPMLGQLRVKELKEYLAFVEIPSTLCFEKADLVELILNTPKSKSCKSPRCKARIASADLPSEHSQQREARQREVQRNRDEQEREALQRQQELEQRQAEQQRRAEEEEQQRREEAQRTAEESSPGQAGSANVSLLTMSRDDVRALSVLQLKKALAMNFVNYRGCVEKKELVDRVLQLWEEQNLSQMDEEDVCKICMDARINCVLLECGHMCCCNTCGRVLAECPICRQYVVRAVHVFRS